MSSFPGIAHPAIAETRVAGVGILMLFGLLLIGAASVDSDRGVRGRTTLESLRAIPVHSAPAGFPTPALRGAASPVVVAGDPDACFDCHDDDGMTMERGGREVSLYVSPEQYAESAHGVVDCVECHVGYDPDEDPHTENPQPIDCGSCHAESARAFQAGGHRRDLSCQSCHRNTHTARGLRTGSSRCVSCHEVAAKEVEGSLHDEDRFGPSCLDCHGAHRVRSANSATCLSCHGEREFVHDHIHGEDIETVLSYAQSIHGDNIECSDCHAGHTVLSTDDPRSPVSHGNIATTCATCHDDVADEYMASEHGRALASGFEGAPTCTDCHGEHDIHQITDSESPVSRQHEVEVCESCHLDAEQVTARMTHTTGFVASYDRSVHGVAAAAGNADAAICSDCHGGHQAMKASNPGSKINQFNIASTCGRCHAEVESVFAGSIHGVALAQGNADSPTCTGCHSEHAIVQHERSDAPVAPLNVSEQVCRPCHESYKLSSKYGFPTDRPSSFGDSYHGLATRFGSDESANCASCHGFHDILPSSDERSKVHPANLQATCGECHPGATARFALGSVHVVRTPEGDALLYWITTIYILVIAVTIGSMAGHNILDWSRKMINHYRERQRTDTHSPAPTRKRGLYLRMTVNERIQHGLLAGSFILLTITGFMLKFPDAWWVVFLRESFGVFIFDLRGILHRVAAVVMVGDSIYHLYYVIFTSRGREFIRDIRFRVQDIRDFWQMIRYYLGARRSRPAFDRFNYIEKSEYWALIWGTVVMTVTGIVLWFENQFMGQFSKLFVDVNETIHYYEAWLAFLAIVVWHFYYVIFNPDVYPMNFTWLTGTITEEEMEHEHPLELQRLKAQEGVSGGPTDTPSPE